MNSIEFFNSISDEERKQLEKSADILTEIFADNVEIGNETCNRLIESVWTHNSEDEKYYEMVLRQCNKIMSLLCKVMNIPDIIEKEVQK